MKLVELLKRLNNLKQVPRTGWLFCDVPLVGIEDVAQHSFEVATITMLLADELKRLGKKIDADRAVGMAILHDWAEAEVTDFPYTALKHLGSENRKRSIELSAIDEILKDNPAKDKYMVLWHEYNDKKTTESRLVHAADYLSVLIQAHKYRNQGIRSGGLDELWRAVKRDLAPYTKEFKAVKQIVNELGGNV